MTAAALRAYGAARGARDLRVQEADVFHRVTGALRGVADDPLRRARALADNRRLWLAIEGAATDPLNGLPTPLRAGLVSIGRAVLRELDSPQPDVDFLIEMNEQVAGGLSGRQ